MASSRIIGYVGGIAVAVGVGAAVAAAGQGVAHADSDTGSAKNSAGDTASADAGPKADTRTTKPGKDTGKGDAAADPDSAVAEAKPKPKPRRTTSLSTTLSTSLPTKLRQSAEAFEAEQVEKLRAAFTPKPVALKPRKTTDGIEPGRKPVTAAAATDTADADGPEPIAASPSGVLPPGAQPTTPSTDPFRPEDPTPFAVPALFRNIEVAVLKSPFVAEEYRPVVREGLEFAYRASQVVPVVDTAVPVSEIVPQVVRALLGDEKTRESTQIVINQLLLTTQPAALLFYGYDEVADLLNMEFAAQELKEQFYADAWDLLDPLHLLHIAGHSGLQRYPGSG